MGHIPILRQGGLEATTQPGLMGRGTHSHQTVHVGELLVTVNSKKHVTNITWVVQWLGIPLPVGPTPPFYLSMWTDALCKNWIIFLEYEMHKSRIQLIYVNHCSSQPNETFNETQSKDDMFTYIFLLILLTTDLYQDIFVMLWVYWLIDQLLTFLTNLMLPSSTQKWKWRQKVPPRCT